jgi:hypothetical protein
VTSGYRPALGVAAGLSLLGGAVALGLRWASQKSSVQADGHTAQLFVADVERELALGLDTGR